MPNSCHGGEGPQILASDATPGGGDGQMHDYRRTLFSFFYQCSLYKHFIVLTPPLSQVLTESSETLLSSSSVGLQARDQDAAGGPVDVVAQARICLMHAHFTLGVCVGVVRGGRPPIKTMAG